MTIGSEITCFNLNNLDVGKKVSTTDAILPCTKYVRTEMDKKNIVFGDFLDLSKAFDSISHEILIEKLKCLGLDGTFERKNSKNSFLRKCVRLNLT